MNAAILGMCAKSASITGIPSVPAQAAVVQLPMAPKEAPCQQTHRLRLFSGDRLVFEYTQHISGIPMGDLFKVEVRWDITPVAGEEASRCQVGNLWPICSHCLS